MKDQVWLALFRLSRAAKQSFDIIEIVYSNRFKPAPVLTMKSEGFAQQPSIHSLFTDYTLEYLQTHGLKQPIVFHETEHLGLVVPRPEFTVADVMFVSQNFSRFC